MPCAAEEIQGGGNRLPPGNRKVRHEAEITVPRPDVRHFFAAVFIILSGGFQDAYTYCCRGSVFANAQTDNIVLLSAALFRGEWRSCQGALRLFPQSRQADAPRRTDLFFIAVFAVGAGIGSYLTVRVGVRAIWACCALLSVSFAMMFVHADR